MPYLLHEWILCYFSHLCQHEIPYFPLTFLPVGTLLWPLTTNTDLHLLHIISKLILQTRSKEILNRNWGCHILPDAYNPILPQLIARPARDFSLKKSQVSDENINEMKIFALIVLKWTLKLYWTIQMNFA